MKTKKAKPLTSSLTHAIELDPNAVIAFRVDADLWKWFHHYCREHNLNPSKAMRAILVDFRREHS